MSSTASKIISVIDQDRTRETLALAAEASFRDSRTTPRPGDVVWYALKEAMSVINRLPDRESGWLYAQRSVWPEVYQDHIDKVDAYETMLERIRIGEEPKDVLKPRAAPPTARAITRMEYVFGWHRHLKGNNRRRDWRIICYLAGGTRAAKVARSVQVSKRTVYDRRELQCSVIANGLKREYGAEIFPDVRQFV